MEKPQINERLLKFTGTLVLKESIEIDHDIALGIQASVQKREMRSNNDGTYNLVHTAHLIGEGVISKDFGKNIPIKAKGSPSQRLRNKMRMDYEGADFDEYYVKMTDKLIANWETIKNGLEQL